MPDTFPLTPLQQAMFAAWRHAPHSGVNLEQWVTTLREAVDLEALRRAWADMVARHGILRTVVDGSDPFRSQQRELDSVAVRVRFIDWSPDAETYAHDDFDERFATWLADDRREGLDLLEPPPWRVTLIRRAERDYRLIVTYHHVLLDGRSLVLLGRELFARYDAAVSRGACDEFASAAAPFSGYANHLDSLDPTISDDYWRATLADLPPTALPYSEHRTAFAELPNHPSREVEMRIGSDAAARLTEYAKRRGVTLHTLVQAAWTLALGALTGARDHVFGSVRACRKQPVEGIDEMLGMLINTVPYRAVIEPETKVGDWLLSLRGRQFELRDHETTPLGAIRRVVGAHDGPLFETLLVFTDRPIETIFDAADGTPHPTRSARLLERSEFPLALAVEAGREIVARLEYNTASYDAATAADLLELFELQLLRLPDFDRRPIAELPTVTPSMFARINKLNNSGRRVTELQAKGVVESVPELLTRRFAEQPAAISIVADDRPWTYAELEAAAARAAVNLQAAGIGPGNRVGVCLPQSPELVASIVAVWSLGAVYVPIDPKYPSRRLHEIAADADPATVIVASVTRKSFAESKFSLLDAADLFSTAQDSSAWRVPKLSANGAAVSSLDAPAVILYTSGSTGAPKGVVLSHRNLANHHAFVMPTIGFDAATRVAPVSSINFDASLEELFCTLAGGGTLCIPATDTLDSFDRFLDFIERHKLTILDLPTSLWRELTNYLYESQREFPPSVKTIFMGGERAARATYERFLKVGGRRMRWINAYGPTETTIISTIYEHDPARDAGAKYAPPIGRPIAGTRVYVLDSLGRLAPSGAVGELYIGGLGVAAGYWRRDKLTAERFLRDPFADKPFAGEAAPRMYRTGDLVRLRHDGDLEYVGRIDDQVKLRGFRIEPAEIEAALLRYAVVRDAAVVVRQAPSGADYLAAYVVCRAHAVFDADALRLFLEQQLPDYMVPRAFVELDALPLSPHGKVARDALPEPILYEPTTGDADRAPTAWEQRILEVWRQTFGLDQVGLDDDFFALGGDSLRAMALSARLEAALGERVAPSLLFKSRTPACLAAELHREAPDASLDPLVLLRDGRRERPLFLIHSLGGDVWVYCELVRRLQTVDAVYGIQLQGLHRGQTPHDSIEVCAAAYIRLMRSVQPVGPYRAAGYSSGGLIALEIARQLRAAGDDVEFLGLIDSGLPSKIENSIGVSRSQRLWSFMKNLPACVRELRGMTFAQQRRRVAGFVGKILRRLIPRRAAADDWELDDREMRECFAEDISFFPKYRLELIQHHYRAVELYEPTVFDGAAHLFRSERRPLFGIQTPTLGWEHLIAGELSIHSVGGTHSTLLVEPQAVELAAAIDRAISDRQASPGRRQPATS